MTVNLTSSSTLHAKMAMYNGTLKSVFDQVLIRYPCFCFFKLFIFISSGFPKMTCAFLANKNQWRNIWIKYFPILENAGVFPNFRLINSICKFVPFNIEMNKIYTKKICISQIWFKNYSIFFELLVYSRKNLF